MKTFVFLCYFIFYDTSIFLHNTIYYRYCLVGGYHVLIALAGAQQLKSIFISYIGFIIVIYTHAAERS